MEDKQMIRIGQATHPIRLTLARRELIAFCQPGPHHLSCETGELWITFDGRGQDLILRPGQCLEFAGGQGVVASALRPASLRLTAPEAVGACLLDAGRAAWSTVRRLRWHFPALATLPVTHLR
jgi:hypothetical protein